MRPRMRSRTWRQYTPRDRDAIEGQLARGTGCWCPRCGHRLAVRPTSRLTAVLPGEVGGYDLDCRSCRQFHPRIQHTGRSLYLLRLQRLAAAVLRA